MLNIIKPTSAQSFKGSQVAKPEIKAGNNVKPNINKDDQFPPTFYNKPVVDTSGTLQRLQKIVGNSGRSLVQQKKRAVISNALSKVQDQNSKYLQGPILTPSSPKAKQPSLPQLPSSLSVPASNTDDKKSKIYGRQ